MKGLCLDAVKVFYLLCVTPVFYYRLSKIFSEKSGDKLWIFVNHFYSQDFHALQSRTPAGISLVELPAPYAFSIFRRVFSKQVRDLWAPYDDTPSSIRRVLYFIVWLPLILLRERRQASVIITPHDNYFWIREFISCAKDVGFKTVLLDKEGLISPYHFNSESKRNKMYAPPLCDDIIVWSDRQREYWISSGAQENQIAVLGMARSDLLFSPPENQLVNGYEKLITVFTYELTAYIPHEYIARGASWRRQRDETHAVIITTAKRNKTIKFIVKCHPQQDDLEEIRREFLDCSNVQVVSGSSTSAALIATSHCIVCFQSTVMIEAVAVRKKIIYAGWSSLEDELGEYLLPFRGVRGVLYCKDSVDFEEQLRLAIADTTRLVNSKYPDDFVNKYIYQPDGKTSQRIISYIAR